MSTNGGRYTFGASRLLVLVAVILFVCACFAVKWPALPAGLAVGFASFLVP